MTKEQMVNLLWERIETSGSLSGDFVLLRRNEAEELARMLSGDLGVKRATEGPEAMKVFYCKDCSRSFSAKPLFFPPGSARRKQLPRRLFSFWAVCGKIWMMTDAPYKTIEVETI